MCVCVRARLCSSHIATLTEVLWDLHVTRKTMHSVACDYTCSSGTHNHKTGAQARVQS